MIRKTFPECSAKLPKGVELSMKSSKRRLLTAVSAAAITAAILASWIGNLRYYRSGQLQAPIFMNHEIKIASKGGIVDLYYLENKQSGKKVNAIQLESMPMIHFDLTVDQSFSRQNLMHAMGFSQGDLKPGTIKEVTVHYNEGQPERVPIGTIEVMDLKGAQAFESGSSGASSDGTGFMSGRSVKDVTLDEVEPSMNEAYRSLLEYDLKAEMPGSGDQALIKLPEQMPAGTPFRIDYRWKEQNYSGGGIPTVFRPWLIFRSHAPDGTALIDYYQVNFNLYLTEAEVKTIVRMEAGK
jgi:hypothetical protein